MQPEREFCELLIDFPIALNVEVIKPTTDYSRDLNRGREAALRCVPHTFMACGLMQGNSPAYKHAMKKDVYY
jgi:hypothetical protein